MRLGEYLAVEAVSSDLSARTKDEVLAEMVDVLRKGHQNVDRDNALKVLRDRERLGTTGIGDGVAIPHGKIAGLDDLILAVGKSRDGVDFEALDQKPCHIFFLVLAPEQAAGQHLRLLAHVSRLLKGEDFKNALLAAPDAESLLKLLATA